jgi:two-component system, OmpR family, KDP operon response regulator KdpE
VSELTITVLLIEDDDHIRRFVHASVDSPKVRVLDAELGRRGLALAASARPNLVIVDLGLPDMDGVDVIRQLRDWSSIPVIVLSARTREDEKVAALDAGADDYLTKPFVVAELMARIREHLRRHNRIVAGVSPTSKICFGDIAVDLGVRMVEREGKVAHADRISPARVADSACGSRADASTIAGGRLGFGTYGQRALPSHLHGTSASEARARPDPT